MTPVVAVRLQSLISLDELVLSSVFVLSLYTHVHRHQAPRHRELAWSASSRFSPLSDSCERVQHRHSAREGKS